MAQFVKERHRQTVLGLGSKPQLAIVYSAGNPVVEKYISLKQGYAQDIGLIVELYQSDVSAASELIGALNVNPDINGIILQLPFDSKAEDRLINLIDPAKDIDNLRGNSLYLPATVQAILWLLAAYNIDLPGKKIAVVGEGKLVGGPLVKTLRGMSLEVGVVDENTKDPRQVISGSEIVISGVGKPNIIKSDWLSAGTVVVDAGTASEGGVQYGDVEDKARSRDDISITPKIGGVGPLTVSALFDNLLRTVR